MSAKPKTKELVGQEAKAVVATDNMPVRSDRYMNAKARFLAAEDGPDRAPKVEKTETSNELVGTDGDEIIRLTQTFGVGSLEFNLIQLHHIDLITQCDSAKTNALLAFAHSLDPKDAVEGALVAQMAVSHHMAMDFMGRAAHSTDKTYVDMKINQVTKLMRTFTAQMEALNRHRGKGQQKVTVEHVTVNAGGQAIVGSVERKDQPGGEKS
jgi:hypothetical protein